MQVSYSMWCRQNERHGQRDICEFPNLSTIREENLVLKMGIPNCIAREKIKISRHKLCQYKHKQTNIVYNMNKIQLRLLISLTSLMWKLPLLIIAIEI